MGHALRIVTAFNEEFPELRYDVTIKIEHILKYVRQLPRLSNTGCLFVTSAVETIDDQILGFLNKGHSRTDFVHSVALMREAGLTIAPTFVPFTPWTSIQGYLKLLQDIVALDLVENVAPIQLAIRLLVPRGSGLIPILKDQGRLGTFDEEALCYRWRTDDPSVDRLQNELMLEIETSEENGLSRNEIFHRIWNRAHQLAGVTAPPIVIRSTSVVPRMSEPWYCCAEPTSQQLAGL